MGSCSFHPLVALFVVGITTRLVGNNNNNNNNNNNKKQNLFRSTMASSLSPNRSSPELETTNETLDFLTKSPGQKMTEAARQTFVIVLVFLVPLPHYFS
jgi:hypothetical protein